MKSLLPLLYNRMINVLPHPTEFYVMIQHWILKIFYCTVHVSRGRERGREREEGRGRVENGRRWGGENKERVGGGEVKGHKLVRIAITYFCSLSLSLYLSFSYSLSSVSVLVLIIIIFYYLHTHIHILLIFLSHLQYQLPFQLIDESTLPGWMIVFQTILDRPVPPVSQPTHALN